MSIGKTPGLYIHIPFCLGKCPYCDFYSITTLELIDPLLTALLDEAKAQAPKWKAFDTVYLGGGTPSLLSPAQLARVMEGLQETFSISEEAEITLEANPGDIDLHYLQSARKLGINRVNIGVQSLRDDILTFLGRRHRRREALAALEAAHVAGFENVGIDLIYALPGQSLASWREDLSYVLQLPAIHLSCYQLTIEPDTPMGTRLAKGEFTSADEDTQSDFFLATDEYLERGGYIHYEVSNFAKGETFYSRHNQKYWNHCPYLGLGPSAHSFDGRSRFWNHRSVEKYIESIKGSGNAQEGSEILTMEQLRLEALFLAMRTRRGIDLDAFKAAYDWDIWEEKGDVLKDLIERKLVAREGHILRPTRRGLAVADSLGLI
ncbi:MAG: radical SAM family heme chaperone HemW [Smithellaceae bacterium]|nr:radical SAM family heme chaperone HemW [Smithellaceae bacterium]